MTALLPLDVWVPIVDGDALASAMYEGHYSSARSLARRRASGAIYILGPGQKLLLSTPCRRALWGWRYARHRKDEQAGVECAIFCNAGAGLASTLVRAADAIADRRWPGLRHFTFVDETKVRGNPPGNVFLHAGWRYQLDDKGDRARSKERGLLILERLP